jgi:hypothetical protein
VASKHPVLTLVRAVVTLKPGRVEVFWPGETERVGDAPRQTRRITASPTRILGRKVRAPARAGHDGTMATSNRTLGPYLPLTGYGGAHGRR